MEITMSFLLISSSKTLTNLFVSSLEINDFISNRSSKYYHTILSIYISVTENTVNTFVISMFVKK